MTGSVNEGTTLSASMSSMPSLVNSLQSLTGSKASINNRPKSPEAEEVIAELLEKAKFYTSLCLGKYFLQFLKIFQTI